MTNLVILPATPNVLPSVACNLIGNAKQSRQGGSSASASSGSGGWQVTDRSRQKATTEWLDYYPMVLSCTCLLDGGPGVSSASVEPQISALESFELPMPGSQPPLPPILTLSGPVPHTDLFWVCSGLDFAGEEESQIRDPSSGLRTQQAFTIEFTEYSPSSGLVVALSPAQQQQQLTVGSSPGQTILGPSGATYTVAQGDTLQSIAAKFFGNVSYWTSIALLNGISNGALLVPGMVLNLPTV
jgi:nucleoid-associated protein YgaU